MVSEPTPEDIERQKEWEAHAVSEGVQRYRNAIAGAEDRGLFGVAQGKEPAFGDTPPGLVAMRSMIRTFVPAIKEAQKLAAKSLTDSGSGRQADWWWLICLLPAEKLAVIVTRSLLTGKDPERKASNAAIEIGSAVQQELEFERWRITEREAVKDDPERTNLFKLLTSRAGRVDAKTFARWKRKLKSIERFEWHRDQKLRLGDVLIDLAIKHGGGWFELRKVYKRGKTERRIRMTAEARQAVTDINARLEVNRPYLLPMKCPPKKWRRNG